jgi:cell division protein FtsW (lipid II flippase)
MEYSEEQIRGFREEFAKHRMTRVLVTVLLVVCAIGFAVFTEASNKTRQLDYLSLSVFLVLIVIGVVFLIVTSRCPACGGLVGRPFRAKFCDQCGVPLQ